MSPTRRGVTVLCFLGILFGMPMSSAQVSRVTIRVILPSTTVTTDRITIAGDHQNFGMWDPSVVTLPRVSDSIAMKVFEFPAGTRLEFKITRGSWETEAIFSPTGEVPANSSIQVERDQTVEVRPLGWRDRMPRPASTLTGETRTLPDLSGEGLRYARTVTVRLPPSYLSDPLKRYPVLYMHDGQNCLDRSTAAFNAEWRADEVHDSLVSRGTIREAIIVAINNTSDRIDEYSDTPRGKAYAAFVARTVKPMIDSVYRTLPNAEHTSVMGSSMGGLISFLFTWWYPEVFGKAACLSSVFDRERTSVIALVEEERVRRERFSVYMDCGGAPGEVSLKPGMDDMVAVLKQRGYAEGTEFVWLFDPHADHSERAWASRLWRPMEFLLAPDRH